MISSRELLFQVGGSKDDRLWRNNGGSRAIQTSTLKDLTPRSISTFDHDYIARCLPTPQTSSCLAIYLAPRSQVEPRRISGFVRKICKSSDCHCSHAILLDRHIQETGVSPKSTRNLPERVRVRIYPRYSCWQNLAYQASGLGYVIAKLLTSVA